MADYDYGNARLHAMRARLLSWAAMEALAETSPIPALIAALLKTPYRTSVETALTHTTGMASVTEALHLDLIEQVRNVRRFYGGEAQEQVALVLRRYDVHNLKAILRGNSKGAPSDEISNALLPLGDLTDAVLDRLAQAPDARAVIDTLATMRLPMAQPLLKLRAEHPGAGTAEMELALDRWYFETARQQLGKGRNNILRAAFDLDADVINILAALRFAHAPLERQMLQIALGTTRLRDVFVAPGRLPLDQLAAVGQQDAVPPAVDLLAATPYEAPLRTALALYQQSNRLSVFEKQLADYRLRRMAALFGQDPLGIGVLLGYLALKLAEIGNIRWVAQGINLGLKADAIKAELAVVS
ncbi:MAG: V-type ATPase subunit [Anaerolineae bacterium]|nr:V-type ATPase subunit [Anaerolineae bacterium]